MGNENHDHSIGECRPLDILKTHGFCKVDLVPRISLKCLATGALLKSSRGKGSLKSGAKCQEEGERIKFREGLGPLPPNMGEFIRLHDHGQTAQV